MKRVLNKNNAPRYLLIAYWGTLVAITIAKVPQISGDTIALSRSTSLLLSCFREGNFTGCAGATQFGLLQYIPSLFLAWKGVSEESIPTVLAILNVFVFVFFSIYFYKTNREFRHRNLFCFLLLAGPMVPYAQSSFAEMLQTVCFLSYIHFIIRGKKGMTVVFAILSVSTRETAFIPLFLLGTAVVVSKYLKDRKRLVEWMSTLVAGIVSGVCALIAFNFVKFGTWKNLPHSDPILFTRDSLSRVSSFLGIWFAPGGGVFVFWAGLSFLIMVVVIRDLFDESNVGLRLTTGLIVLSLLAATLSLSIWYSPFGWIAWGPRLMIPLITAVALVIWLQHQQSLTAVIESIRNRVGFQLLVISIVVISATPSIGYQLNPNVANEFYLGDPICNTSVIIQENQSLFFNCLRSQMWKTNTSLWETGFQGFTSGYFWILPLFLALGLFLAIREKV